MVDGAKREDGLKKCQLNLRVFFVFNDEQG